MSNAISSIKLTINDRQVVDITFRPRRREGKTLGWQVERWNGKKWEAVPKTCCHYEQGAIDTAQQLAARVVAHAIRKKVT